MSDRFERIDRFEAIGQLEERLVGAHEGLTSHWEVRGPDPVLTVRGDGLEAELVPEDGGRFRLSAEVTAEQAAQVVALLARPRSPAPSRTRSRRLVAAV